MKSLGWIILAAALAPAGTLAQTVAQTPPPADGATAAGAVLPQVNVVGTAPLLGSGIDQNQIPAASYVLDQKQVQQAYTPRALDALNQLVPSVNLSDAQGNPFQQNLFFRGFEASSLAGAPQGLAVYLNGVRFNQPFADTINWDLFPEVAIQSMNVEGANPVFGLNALGGSIAVQLKDGFGFHGGQSDTEAGSYGRVSSTLQYGVQSGNVATYVALSALNDDGWRIDQSSQLRNFYGDLGWRSDAAEVHFSVMGADNYLNGPASAPVQFLAANPAAVLTAPNQVVNRYLQVALRGNYDISDTTALQALAYYTNLSQRVRNGNASNGQVCNNGIGLCTSDGVTPFTDRSGAQIPDFLNGGPYSEQDNQGTDENGYGASLQATDTHQLFGRPNHFTAGLSFDGGQTMFDATSFQGGLSTDGLQNWFGPGYVIDTPGVIQPARVFTTNAYYGIYASDILDVTDRLSFTLSGRLNDAQLNLSGQNGTPVFGQHNYSHFNPGAGATYKLFETLSLYGGWAVANRAPTPVELSCASPTDACSIANFFVGDPSLKQVVAQTFEAGLRGNTTIGTAALSWTAGVYRTNSQDDIQFTAVPVSGFGYFQNIGNTQRQGVELGSNLKWGRLSAYLNYSYTDATYQSSFIQNSYSPFANANGQIFVHPGNRLPGIPANQLKFGMTYNITDQWSVGIDGIARDGAYLFGDEANQNPKTPGYVVLNLNTSFRPIPGVEFYGIIQNLLNQNYYSFGTFSPTSSVPYPLAPGATNPRSLSPGWPIAGYGGVRLTF